MTFSSLIKHRPQAVFDWHFKPTIFSRALHALPKEDVFPLTCSLDRFELSVRQWGPFWKTLHLRVQSRVKQLPPSPAGATYHCHAKAMGEKGCILVEEVSWHSLSRV